ncbi:uncharacterized protein XB22166507.L [provisonal] isoform X2 [Xenopus laevis]|uniref:Uncharacterized protein XB22166507.L [provisonal] isoform X2 n=1 Tax=Xenopus laevis TaxID=8355 RepID=A0A8J1MNX2_XENLA|nr:uncharacterized protein XB22166507.L [provisonal] isoform X2 [Xenopus laevis]
MSPSLSLLLVGAALCTAADGDVIRHELYGEVGKSVAIPMVDFDLDGWWELKKPNSDPDWVVNYHGWYAFQFLYESRGQIIKSNRTVLLKNLTKSDSWEYEQWANGKLWSKINIQVLDPLYPPVLWSEGPSPEACLVLLQCEGSGGSAETLALMKDGEEVKGNITVMGNISVFTINVGDPLSWGQYTCEKRNPMSSKASKSIMVGSPVSLMETLCFCLIIAGLAFSLYVIAFGLFWNIIVPRARQNKRIKASPLIKGLADVVFIVKILSPLAATVVSAFGHYLISFFQVSFIVLSVAFFAIRIFFSIIPYCQYCSNLSNYSFIKWIMGFTDYFFISGFFLSETILFSRNYPPPCEKTLEPGLLYTLPWFIPCVLLVLAVFVYRKVKPWNNATEQNPKQPLAGDRVGGMDTGMEGSDSCKPDSSFIGVAAEGDLATG